MSEDIIKLLALVFVGIVGYLYAQRGQKAALRENRLESIVKEKENAEQTEKKVRSTPLGDLIRAANERLRKRRSPGADE